MKHLFLITLLILAGLFAYDPSLFGVETAQSSASASQSPQARGSSRVYENYPGNTVPAPTWSDSADEMVFVSTAGAGFLIDKYEAVISEQRAWSVANVTPTTKLTFKDAKDACQAAGKRRK